MPIYEYRCSRCGDFEEMQRITDPPLTRCPTCRGKLVRLISNTSFQLKGSGWYVTDYARSGSGKEAKAEGGSAPTGEAAKGSKAEGKADAKSEGKLEGKSEGKSKGKSEGESEGKSAGPAAPTGGTTEKPAS